MDVDGLPLVGSAVDLTKVGPIHQKRTLAFINHFVCHTVNFLNKFSSVCETKLEEINCRIQRIETSLSILEAKLSSIPGLEDLDLKIEQKIKPVSDSISSQPPLPPPPSFSTQTEVRREETTVAEKGSVEVNETKSSVKTVSQDPRYSKYFKLIQLGVPPMAVRPKMIAEGLDPDLLDTPNAEAPPQNEDTYRNDVSESSETNSEFSD